MNREQTIEAIKVMQAWVDGEEIQVKHKASDLWVGIPAGGETEWVFEKLEYRIKPKPMRKYVVVGESGVPYVYGSYEGALEHWPDGPFNGADWHGWMVEEAK